MNQPRWPNFSQFGIKKSNLKWRLNIQIRLRWSFTLNSLWKFEFKITVILKIISKVTLPRQENIIHIQSIRDKFLCFLHLKAKKKKEIEKSLLAIHSSSYQYLCYLTHTYSSSCSHKFFFIKNFSLFFIIAVDFEGRMSINLSERKIPRHILDIHVIFFIFSCFSCPVKESWLLGKS